MYALQKLGGNGPKLISTLNRQARLDTVLAGKPRQRIPFAEKVAHGIVMLGVPMIIPLYFSSKINEWRGSPEE